MMLRCVNAIVLWCDCVCDGAMVYESVMWVLDSFMVLFMYDVTLFNRDDVYVCHGDMVIVAIKSLF